MNVRKIVTICSLCKEELKVEVDSEAFASMLPNEEVLFSHGLCYECGKKLYGAELMGKVRFDG